MWEYMTESKKLLLFFWGSELLYCAMVEEMNKHAQEETEDEDCKKSHLK